MPATTEIYTLSLHDALPIFARAIEWSCRRYDSGSRARRGDQGLRRRSEEHTSELQSHSDLVCRLLLEKKKRYVQMDALRARGPATCTSAAVAQHLSHRERPL